MESKNIFFDLKWAQTLDGQLADDQSVSKWISGDEELKETHRMRKLYSGVLVGGKTFLKDLSKLTIREVPMGKMDKQPVRIILDPRGRVADVLDAGEARAEEVKAELINNSLRPTLILCPQEKAGALGELVKMRGSGLVHVPFTKDLSSPDFPMHLSDSLKSAAHLLMRPMEEVLVEGGAHILKFFIESAYFRKLIITVSPKMTGGYKNRVFLSRSLEGALQLSLEEVKMIGQDLVMEYEPKRRDLSRDLSNRLLEQFSQENFSNV